MIPKGIHPGLGMKEYHGWSLDRSNIIEGPISCSTLKRFAPNPFEWANTPDIVQTKAMRTGSLFDAALTDPKEVEALLPLPVRDFSKVVFSPYKDFRSKEAQKWRDDALLVGEEIMKPKELEEAKASYQADIELIEAERQKCFSAAQAVRDHDEAGKILDGCEFQVGAIGDIGGIPAKCLIDILPSKEGDYAEAIVDYKTTGNGIDDESIRKSIGQFKYHWQAAFYRTLFNKVSTDRVCEDFIFIFQSTATLEVRVVRLADDALALGTRAVKDAVEEFVRCAHKGIGSRYARFNEDRDTLDLMPYHAMSEDERLSLKQEGAV